MVYKWRKHLKINLRNESIDINNVHINCNTYNILHHFFVFKIFIRRNVINRKFSVFSMLEVRKVSVLELFTAVRIVYHPLISERCTSNNLNSK